MRNKAVTALFLSTLLIISCTGNKTNDILLQAGKYAFTVADYNMLKTRMNSRFLSPKQESNLIDNAYIMAFALDNRYDTITLLSKKLMYGMRLYSSEVNGYVWNKKVKPNLKVSNNDINEAYAKRAVEYTIEFINFPDSVEMNKYCKRGSDFDTEKGFYALKRHVSAIPDITSSVLQSVYPFYPFGVYADKIYNAQKGDVLGPIEMSSGYFLLHVADIRTIRQPSYNNEKSIIKQELLNVIAEKYIMQSQNAILGMAKPQMHDKAILYMASKFDNKTRQWQGVDENRILMNYQFKGKMRFFTAGDLEEFINCEPISIGSPSKANDIKEMMQNFLMDIYLYEEAKNMKAGADPEFMAFKRYYRNKLFIQHYYDQYIYPKMKITPAEAQQYYNQNKNNQKGFESAMVAIYKFRDRKSAFNGLGVIYNYCRQNNRNPASPGLQLSMLPGILSVNKQVVIHVSDTTNNVGLINAISEANAGQMLMPLKINREFWVVCVLKKIGNAILPYKYAELGLERMLLERKTQEALDKQISILKVKYPLVINRLKKYMQDTEKREN